jgi:hypothetical protein
MDASQQQAVVALAGDILEHLHKYPQAADSAAGVTRWWLTPAHANATVELVEQALDWLVSRGILRRLLLTDGGVLYSHVLPTQQ